MFLIAVAKCCLITRWLPDDDMFVVQASTTFTPDGQHQQTVQAHQAELLQHWSHQTVFGELFPQDTASQLIVKISSVTLDIQMPRETVLLLL